MMEPAKPPNRSGVNINEDRTAVPPGPGKAIRSNRVVVGLRKDMTGHSAVPSPEDGELIGVREDASRSGESTQAENPAQERLAEQRRLACMRVHPSNGRYLREVLPQRDAG